MTDKQQKTVTYFLYARKSSEGEDRQVQSIDDQIGRLHELAERCNFVIKAEFIEAKSAKKPYCRPVFADMLKRIERGEANGILCWELNRLSRNPIDSGSLSWHLQQGTVQCIQTINRKYLPDDNVLLFNVESGMANQFIIDLRKNSRRGMEGKVQRGWLPSRAPLGYNNDKLERNIVPDPTRFTLIRKMWEMMLTGTYTPEQIRTIATTQWGLRTQKFKRTGGKELSYSVMYKMFSNIFYTGLFEWDGTVYEGKHQPMITVEEYDAVQKLLGRRGNPRPQTHNFAYTGLIQCGMCGSMYTATEKAKLVKATGKSKTYVYYHCTRKKRHITCTGQPVSLTDLETQIQDTLTTSAILPIFKEWADVILSELETGKNQQTIAIRKTQEASLAKLQLELDTLTRMRYRDLIDDETFIKERDILQIAIAKLKHTLANDKDMSGISVEQTRKAFHFVLHAKEVIEHGNIKCKKEILSTIGSNRNIRDKKLLIRATDWLVPIRKAYPALETEYKRLELDKTLTTERRNQAIASIYLRWGSIVEEVRTVFLTNENSSISIPLLHDKDTTSNSEPQ